MDTITYNTRYKKRKLNSIGNSPRYYSENDENDENDDTSETEDEDYEVEYNSEGEGISDISSEEEDLYEDDVEYEEDWIKDLTNIIVDKVNKTKNLKEDLKDEYNKEFLDLCENNVDKNNTDEDFKYFKSLDKDVKIKYLDKIKKNINYSDIPLKFKILNSNMDDETRSIALYNINLLDQLDNSSGEYHKMFNWINGVIKIPFGNYIDFEVNNMSTIEKKQQFLKKSYEKLTNAIYGHEKAKSYILQVICKWIQNPKSYGNILALQGPMGNGKTTLVKEGIAKSINRPFAFISLGGASDSSYFNGHSYTYEGSTWGRILDILIRSKCMNPIIYFDELDKVSTTHKGDEIVHFLTHITDLSQNSMYQDNYFPGINIDLSKILFIFSFNDESKVDKILKDRMNVIHTKGFSVEDKIKITNGYILPEIYESYNLSKNNLIFSDEIISNIIKNYTQNEQGVRNLKRCIDIIISKINMYYILYDKDKKSCYIDLPYVIDDFKFPYTLKVDDLKGLLDLVEKEGPPEHMYI